MFLNFIQQNESSSQDLMEMIQIFMAFEVDKSPFLAQDIKERSPPTSCLVPA
jgi:hypothetical protein